jgi:hypothetical protein
MTNRCINEMPNDTELSSEMLQVPDIQDGLLRDTELEVEKDSYQSSLEQIDLCIV